MIIIVSFPRSSSKKCWGQKIPESWLWEFLFAANKHGDELSRREKDYRAQDKKIPGASGFFRRNIHLPVVLRGSAQNIEYLHIAFQRV